MSAMLYLYRAEAQTHTGRTVTPPKSRGQRMTEEGENWEKENMEEDWNTDNQNYGRREDRSSYQNKPRNEDYGSQQGYSQPRGGGYRFGGSGGYDRGRDSDRRDRSNRGGFGGSGFRNFDSTPDFRANQEIHSDRPPPVTYEPQEPTQDEKEIFSGGISSGIDFENYFDIPVEVTGGCHVYEPIEELTSRYGIDTVIERNVIRSNYLKPTPIQKHAIPILLSDQTDIMACAQTGSGKTASFIIPTFCDLLKNRDDLQKPQSFPAPSILVLGPTRELVVQIWNEMRKFSVGTPIKSAVVYGGVARNFLLRQMNLGCHALAATPGRLMQFVNQSIVDLSQVRYLILDEADRMLDMGFIGPIRDIVNRMGMPPVGQRRTCMFSATFPVEIQNLAREMLTDDYFFITIGVVGSAASSITQQFESAPIQEKRTRLIEILNENYGKKTLVFVETKRTADYLASFLLQSDIAATSIHGDRTQEQRELALNDFKRGTHNVLLATGVAARGLDIPNVEIVLNYDLPNAIDEYVHRIGRTGRVGNHGVAISFYQPGKDDAMIGPIMKILQDSKQEIPDWLSSISQTGSSGYHVGSAGGSKFASRDTRYGAGQGGQSRYRAPNQDSESYSEPKAVSETFPVASSWSKEDGEPYGEECWD